MIRKTFLSEFFATPTSHEFLSNTGVIIAMLHCSHKNSEVGFFHHFTKFWALHIQEEASVCLFIEFITTQNICNCI